MRLPVALVPGQGIPGCVAPGGAAAPKGPARACESRAPPTPGVRARVRALVVHAQHAAARQCVLSACRSTRSRTQRAAGHHFPRLRPPASNSRDTRLRERSVSSTSVGDRKGLCSDGALCRHQPGRRSPGRSARYEPMEKYSGNTTRLRERSVVTVVYSPDVGDPDEVSGSPYAPVIYVEYIYREEVSGTLTQSRQQSSCGRPRRPV